MEESKSVFMSKTFWGLVVALAAMVAKGYGLEIDQAGLVNDLVGFAGGAFALYGRFKAQTDLHVLPPKKDAS